MIAKSLSLVLCEGKNTSFFIRCLLIYNYCFILFNILIKIFLIIGYKITLRRIQIPKYKLKILI